MNAAVSSRKNLITGITGFAGPHLARSLIDQGESVVGYTIEGGSERSLPRIPVAAEVRFGDIRDAETLALCIADVRPDVVYHMAALSHVGESWHRRRETFDVNILGTEAVLDAMAKSAPDATLLLVSSGFVYGKSSDTDPPLTEDHPTRPVSPYAASKLCAEVLGTQAARARGLRVVVVRPFNFAGPGQEPTFVCSDFARQIAWAENDLRPAEIVVGSLDVRRDFTDVRDIVSGFEHAARLGNPGAVYNLCSGEGIAIQLILDTLVGLARRPIDVRVDADRIRPIDLPLFVGDPGRAEQQLQWSARIPLEKTLVDTLDYWREEAAQLRRQGDSRDA